MNDAEELYRLGRVCCAKVIVSFVRKNTEPIKIIAKLGLLVV